MTMFFKNERKPTLTRVVDPLAIRVLLLSAAGLLLAGFSNQGGAYRPSAETVMQAAAEPLAIVVEDFQEPPVIVAEKQAPQRVKSYARNASLNTVLDKVDSHRWLLNSSSFANNEHERQWILPSAIFRDVGFPDVQVNRTAKPSSGSSQSRDDSWNTMIAWRTRTDLQQEEPIAYVRCMGLSPQAVARRADQFDRLILDLAIEHNVSASLIKAVVTMESCFNNKALSPAGAQGLMQLMPATADWLKVRDPHDPEDNLRAGVRYIAHLQEQFDTLELVLAAYNAGPGNVRRYSGVPPFAETQAYVVDVQAHYRRYVAATRLAAQ